MGGTFGKSKSQTATLSEKTNADKLTVKELPNLVVGEEGGDDKLSIYSNPLVYEISDQVINTEAECASTLENGVSATATVNGLETSINQIEISLVPHVHTLFCERKQRVCTAVDKLQEMETLMVNLSQAKLSNCQTVWIRSHKGSKQDSSISTYHEIPGTENSIFYQLTTYDIDCYINFKISEIPTLPINSENTITLNEIESNKINTNNANKNLEISKLVITECSPNVPQISYAPTSMGPIESGPPRMLELAIIIFPGNPGIGGGDGPDMKLTVGMKVVAAANYIGGLEGGSEYWWMRVRNGERENVCEPCAIPSSSLFFKENTIKDLLIEKEFNFNEESVDNKNTNDHDNKIESKSTVHSKSFIDDPRIYIITPDDIGCILKVKCRPIRSDGYAGEIFTSKPSPKITN